MPDQVFLPAAYRTHWPDLQRSTLSSHPTHAKRGVCIMAEMKEKTSNVGEPARPPAETTSPSKIDPTAPAGSENSLGAESVRDGRPATDDRTVEAMDEESPDISGTLDTAAPDDSD